MKNKVLRLAIVAVIVVAMVLSMAACVDPVSPTPVPTPGSSPSTTPGTTNTPGKTTPEAGSDEAALESKYGITFPVAEDMKFVYVPAPTGGVAKDVIMDKTNKEVTFKPKFPDYNDAYNAYGASIGVTSKVTGLTKEGVKISITTDENTPGEYIPTAAGTYTVTYTVKVNFAQEEFVGFFKPAKVSETYTVVKTYEVAKRKITVESKADASKKSDKLEFKICEIKYGGINDAEDKKIQEELKIAATGDNAKYSLSANILDVDSTAYGSYPMNLVCTLAGKTEAIDIATLTAPNYEVTFKNGSRHVLTDAEFAAALAVGDDIKGANADDSNKEDIALGVATYTALSEGAKVYYNQALVTADENTSVTKMLIKQEDLKKVGMVEEALRLAKVWHDKLQNVEDGRAFTGYMVGLSTDPNLSTVTKKATYSDFDYVIAALGRAYAKNEKLKYVEDAVKLVDVYKKLLVTEFFAETAALESALTEAKGAFANPDGITKAGVESAAKALAKLQTKFEALMKDQKDKTVAEINTAYTMNEKDGEFYNTSFKLKEIMAKSVAFNTEFAARFASYETLIADLDAYTDVEKVTLAGMKSLLGYQFDSKSIANAGSTVKPEGNSAANILFATKGDTEADKYIVFSTPLTFIAEATTSYKDVVDAYVALDAAIVEEQAKIMATLGSKLSAAGKGDQKVASFDGEYFVKGTEEENKYLMYEALQLYLGKKILEVVFVPEYTDNAANPPLILAVHFEALAKKGLAEVIAAALKGPVNDMNGWIKEWDSVSITRP